MNIYLAKLDTRNFSFEAYGSTKTLAETALTNGLHKHALQFGIPLDWFDKDEIEVCQRELGQCLRDGEILCAS